MSLKSIIFIATYVRTIRLFERQMVIDMKTFLKKLLWQSGIKGRKSKLSILNLNREIQNRQIFLCYMYISRSRIRTETQAVKDLNIAKETLKSKQIERGSQIRRQGQLLCAIFFEAFLIFNA